MSSFIIFTLFMFGASIGSFCNVLILRFNPDKKKAKKKLPNRSYCPHCKRQLTWYELIPIFSYIFLRAQCRTCKKQISVQYPIVELSTGILSLILLLPLTPQTIFISLITFTIACLLIVLFVIDLRTFYLPDTYILLLITAVIIHISVTQQYISTSILGALAGAGSLLFLWIITKGRGLGLGDVKLMVPLGLLFGVTGVITLLFIAFITGGMVGAYLLISGKAHLKTAVPFGPYLTGAAILLLIMPELPHRFFILLGV